MSAHIIIQIKISSDYSLLILQYFFCNYKGLILILFSSLWSLNQILTLGAVGLITRNILKRKFGTEGFHMKGLKQGILDGSFAVEKLILAWVFTKWRMCIIKACIHYFIISAIKICL
jgi:hypothetical protein